ncbi:MAG: outer membrane beta-barrel protein [Muribaculaceae bacterium]|nr:outer membrane beta-barrel protein [Muribaculaceae bacterium]
MKFCKVLLAAALILGSSMPMMAQFSNAGGSSFSSSQEIPSCFNRITFGYDATFVSIPKDYSSLSDLFKSPTFNGFSVKYVHGWSLSSRFPLYIDAGLRLNMNFYSKVLEEDTYKQYSYKSSVSSKMMSLSVPINISYRLGISDGISIQPYTGINFKVNVLGDITSTVEYTGEYGSEKESETKSWFDEDYKEYGAKRFQMGWQIGLGVNFRKFYLGLEYGIDFMNLCKPDSKYFDDIKGIGTSHVEVSLGINI